MLGYGGSRLSSSMLWRQIPVTLGLIAAATLTFLLAFFGMRAGLGGWLANYLAVGTGSLVRPWTWLAWPILNGPDPITLIFSAAWAFTVCGSLERSWGSAAFARFFAVTAGVTGLSIAVGCFALKASALLGGLWLALAAPTIAWCLINRRETILFCFVIPLPAMAFAWLTVAFTFFLVGLNGNHPFLGLFGLMGCLLAYFYVSKGRDWTFGLLGGRRRTSGPNLRFADFDRETRSQPSRNPLTRAKEERERKERDRKLAEMFRRSGLDDSDPR